MNRSEQLHAKCFVPSCKNTTTNSRNKVFVLVKEPLKQRFCEQANAIYIPGRRMFCCEDHLKLEEDLENYSNWRITKKRPVLKNTAKLRFMCKQSLPTCSRADEDLHESQDEPSPECSVLKRLLMEPSKDVAPADDFNILSISKLSPTSTSVFTQPTKIDAAIQCSIKMETKSTSTKDFKFPKAVLSSLVREEMDTSASTQGATSSASFFECTSEIESSTPGLVENLKNYETRQQFLRLVYNNSKEYIGIPNQFLWLIDHIVQQSTPKVTELDIIITLNKIKLNDPVFRICDQLQVSKVSFTKSFHLGVQVLATFFQNLIYMPTLLQIKQNQPLAFKIRYSNVQLLLDAFEIEIQKPHNPKSQAQTWSQYKNANTVKFLVGSTPNGFISYISEGYGGRISDKALVEKSDLLECLPHNAIIMADRGFKEIESYLACKGIKLLRPPSVFGSIKPKKEEVILTKVIASLRVHIERVIRRIREFRFLKPHSVISHKHVSYLDHVVIIACGLINLQNEIIKSEY